MSVCIHSGVHKLPDVEPDPYPDRRGEAGLAMKPLLECVFTVFAGMHFTPDRFQLLFTPAVKQRSHTVDYFPLY